MKDWSELEGLARRKRKAKNEPPADWKSKFLEARPRAAEIILHWDRLVVLDLSRLAEATWGDGFDISKTDENGQAAVDLFNLDRFVAGQLDRREIGFGWKASVPNKCYEVLIYFKDFSPTRIIVRGKTAQTTNKANETGLKKALLTAFEAGPRDI